MRTCRPPGMMTVAMTTVRMWSQICCSVAQAAGNAALELAAHQSAAELRLASAEDRVAELLARVHAFEATAPSTEPRPPVMPGPGVTITHKFSSLAFNQQAAFTLPPPTLHFSLLLCDCTCIGIYRSQVDSCQRGPAGRRPCFVRTEAGAQCTPAPGRARLPGRGWLGRWRWQRPPAGTPTGSAPAS